MQTAETKIWQAKRVSNPQPSVLETDTLPIELLACNTKTTKAARGCSRGIRLILTTIQ